MAATIILLSKLSIVVCSESCRHRIFKYISYFKSRTIWYFFVSLFIKHIVQMFKILTIESELFSFYCSYRNVLYRIINLIQNLYFQTENAIYFSSYIKPYAVVIRMIQEKWHLRRGFIRKNNIQKIFRDTDAFYVFRILTGFFGIYNVCRNFSNQRDILEVPSWLPLPPSPPSLPPPPSLQ